MSSAQAVAETSAPRAKGRDELGPRVWRESIEIVLAFRVAFFLLALAALWMLASKTTGAPGIGAFDAWRRWDANHLLTLAEHGYTAPESDAHAAAFFPLFPLCVRALLFLGIPTVLAGMLVSAISSVVAGAFLYRLAEEEFGPGTGRRALVYLMVFPTAVFLIAPYSEALFLAGAIPAFYFARRQRWEWVGLPAAVAMGARAAGIFLLIGLAVEFVRQRDFSKVKLANAGLALVIGFLPLLAYGAFLNQAFGNPFQFIVHQKEGWGRELTNPVDALRTTLRGISPGTATNWILAWQGEVIAAALGVAATLWAAAKREWGYAAYMGSTMAALLTSTWYFSIPRMLLGLFPIVLFLAEATKDRRWLHETVLVVFAPLAALGVVVYTSGAWFY
ncbi:MAG: hypothetical protein QOG54_635 [Actinomycetota bacterium]|nr:hypothetical protein [Actinomycetota bacterium]